AYLRTLPVDILKIDRSFTAPLTDTDPRQARAFTKAILELSASLGLSTVVEGVESREQAAVLQQMGCPLAQGYLFSQPAPARADRRHAPGGALPERGLTSRPGAPYRAGGATAGRRTPGAAARRD
ncbi:EAL domain-containing protein, partial [Planomonospora algeriensis]